MSTAGMGNKKIATTLGLPLSTTKRRLQRLYLEGEMVGDNAAKKLVYVQCSLYFSSHISRIARDLCVCFVGLMVKMRLPRC